MDDETRAILERPFPAESLKKRQGPSGIVLTYAEIQIYVDRLNEAFRGIWSWEVLRREQVEDQLIVEGRLTAGGVTKTGMGGAAITRRRDGGGMVSLADDAKTAEADAIKRACRLLGIGRELYCADDSTDRPAVAVKTAAPQRMPAKAARPAPARQETQGAAPEKDVPAPAAGRVTTAQLAKLRELIIEAGENWVEYRAAVRERHGINVEYADRALASTLISERLAGAQRRRQNGSGNGYRRSP